MFGHSKTMVGPVDFTRSLTCGPVENNANVAACLGVHNQANFPVLDFKIGN